MSILKSNSGSLPIITSCAKLSTKLRAHLCTRFGSPTQLVEFVAEHGWKMLLKTVPGFGKVYAIRLQKALTEAGYSVPLVPGQN